MKTRWRHIGPMPVILVVWLLLAAGGVNGEPVADKGADPLDARIAQAVKELGADDFKTREAATKFLWENGARAEPVLRGIRNDPDPEVAMRVRRLLEDIELGIGPDTPKEIREKIVAFKGVEPDARQQLVVELLEAGKPTYRALMTLARSEKDVEPRMYVFWPLAETTLETVRAVLKQANPEPSLRDKAIALARVCMEAFPEDISPAIELVSHLSDTGNVDPAQALFEDVRRYLDKRLAETPDDAETLNNFAWLSALTRQHLDRGLELAQKAVTLQPNTAAYLDTLAELKFVKGQQQEAIELMRACLRIEPDTEYYREQLKRFEKNDTQSRPPVALMRSLE